MLKEQDLRDSPSAHIVSPPIIPETSKSSSSTSAVSFLEDHRHRHHHEKTPLQLQSKMVGLRIAGEREKSVVQFSTAFLLFFIFVLISLPIVLIVRS